MATSVEELSEEWRVGLMKEGAVVGQRGAFLKLQTKRNLPAAAAAAATTTSTSGSRVDQAANNT